MSDYREILKRAGIVLIIIGLIDIGYSIYVFTNRGSYSSSLNVFAVIAGILLWRGHLGAARTLTWITAFALAIQVVMIPLAVPSLMPIGLLAAKLRFAFIPTLTSGMLSLLAIAATAWVYMQFRSAPVLQALKNSGRSTATPRLAFGLGIGIAIATTVALAVMLNSASADKAAELARRQLGPGYTCTTLSITWRSIRTPQGVTSKQTIAMVAAYNDKRLVYLPVGWSE